DLVTGVQTCALPISSYPDVALTLAEGEPEEIVPRLRAGELDLALLFDFDLEGPPQEGMTHVPLLEDPMYLVLPREHPLAAKQRRSEERRVGTEWRRR